MKQNTTRTIMKCMGATLAVCSAVAMAGSSKMMGSGTTKKTMKKTINKVADVVDTVAGML
ncbi:MAG: hypothetical protein ACI4IL_01120 [Eubacterium sp.]